LKKYLKEVESRLIPHKPNPKTLIWDPKDYVGGGLSEREYLSIKIPVVRSEFKRGFSFSSLPTSDQWQIWDYIWKNSNLFEVMLLSSYFVGTRPLDEVFNNRATLISWLDRVDNWAHSDELSSHYSKLLEFNPPKLMPVFEKWNRSKKPWFKRQSMVGLMYYSRMRKIIPKVDTILKFVDRHMKDDHYYVQKGVGWTLRESWNVYPKKTYEYLKRNAHLIPPAGWTAATEKLSKKDKDLLTSLRRTRLK
jgi:3-methyladenine DNA glycosylase AlkD